MGGANAKESLQYFVIFEGLKSTAMQVNGPFNACSLHFNFLSKRG